MSPSKVASGSKVGNSSRWSSWRKNDFSEPGQVIRLKFEGRQRRHWYKVWSLDISIHCFQTHYLLIFGFVWILLVSLDCI